MKILNSCISCNSENNKNLGIPFLHNSNSKYSVVKCLNCGLMWCSPMEVENYKEYYNKYYNRRFSTLKINFIKKFIKNLLNWEKLSHNKFFKLIEKYLPNKGVLVDYGYGEGYLLITAKKRGWNAIGVEYTPELSEKFLNLGFEIIISPDIDSCGFKEKSIDCMVAKHVVEHLVDLDDYLLKVKNYLKPGGIFAIKTPSNNSLFAKFGITNWHYVNPPEHQWSFNTKSFNTLMKSHGYKILYLKNSILVNELVCIATQDE